MSDGTQTPEIIPVQPVDGHSTSEEFEVNQNEAAVNALHRQEAGEPKHPVDENSAPGEFEANQNIAAITEMHQREKASPLRTQEPASASVRPSALADTEKPTQ